RTRQSIAALACRRPARRAYGRAGQPGCKSTIAAVARAKEHKIERCSVARTARKFCPTVSRSEKPARRQGNRRSRQSRRSGSCACRQSVRRPPGAAIARKYQARFEPSSSVRERGAVFIASVFWTNEAAATL